jgi:hypothetical protein
MEDAFSFHRALGEKTVMDILEGIVAGLDVEEQAALLCAARALAALPGPESDSERVRRALAVAGYDGDAGGSLVAGDVPMPVRGLAPGRLG